MIAIGSSDLFFGGGRFPAGELGSDLGVRGEAFRLCVDSVGYWKHNRIVWAGCRAWPAALDALVGELRQALDGVGLASGREAAFFPHVTLLHKGHAAERLPPVEPICVKVNDAARMIGVGRTKLYELIAAGEVDVVKLGKSTRITTASLRALIQKRCSTQPA